MPSNEPEVILTPSPETIEQGGRVRLTARLDTSETYFITEASWNFPGRGPFIVQTYDPDDEVTEAKAVWHVPDDQTPGTFDIRVKVTAELQPVRRGSGGSPPAPITVVVNGKEEVTVRARPFASGDAVAVTMRRGDVVETDDQAFWVAIRNSTQALSFNRYSEFLAGTMRRRDVRRLAKLQKVRALPFPDMDQYRVLKTATEVFMMAHCGVRVDANRLGRPFKGLDLDEERVRLNRPDLDDDPFRAEIRHQWEDYITEGPRLPGEEDQAFLPYLAVIRLKLGDVDIVGDRDFGVNTYGILQSKLTNPCLIELIWNYWHREAHLVHAMSALLLRFQNVRTGRGPDPLAHLEIDPLRPLSNLMWGMVNDEQHRLTDTRVAYELFHHYGISMLQPGQPPMRPADSRVHFLSSFHRLLHVVSIFLKEDDDTTVLADAFPVLNALKEVHLQLTEGQGNQYLELPWQARQEDLMYQYMLARPEMREFLPSRVMVAYPEAWMDPVETVKRLYGWPDASVLHFRDLAIFGEQLLLGIRYGNWNDIRLPQQAANWVRYWRPELQGYIHAYQAVTGADLTVDPVDTTMPSILLRQRLLDQLAGTGSRRTSAAPVQLPGDSGTF
ncbi:hypothetical protein AB0I34_17295 [Kribbella sp. NPDC050281]|uniref:hypothetical protein n=1 Tax=Kribbella sp. NPDC050281 TaxID=3155515 RepID=UPI0033C0A5B9